MGILLAFAIGLPYDGKEATVNLLGNETAWWRVMFALGLVPAVTQVNLKVAAQAHCDVDQQRFVPSSSGHRDELLP